MKTKKQSVYLDYAATTPVDARVTKAMAPYFSSSFGNPGSFHGFGQKAMAAVDAARESLASAIGAGFRDVIFTSSATEANNLFLRGVFRNARALLKEGRTPRVIVSSIEHESVLETARDLGRLGADVVFLPVDRGGFVDLSALSAALSADAVLVSIMYANNEIGSIEPIRKAADMIRDFRSSLPPRSVLPLFHTDASQAFQFLDCGVDDLGVDAMTLSSHKIYGPKGASALYIRASAKSAVAPLIAGGGQEFGMRSGTENVPAIVGFAAAAQLIDIHAGGKVALLRDEFLWRLRKLSKNVIRNAPSSRCLPHILNVSFLGFDAQDILTRLDLAGIAVSSGSACRSRALEASYVLEALGYDGRRVRSSVRFSLGRETNRAQIAYVCSIIKKILISKR